MTDLMNSLLSVSAGKPIPTAHLRREGNSIGRTGFSDTSVHAKFIHANPAEKKAFIDAEAARNEATRKANEAAADKRATELFDTVSIMRDRLFNSLHQLYDNPHCPSLAATRDALMALDGKLAAVGAESQAFSQVRNPLTQSQTA